MPGIDYGNPMTLFNTQLLFLKDVLSKTQEKAATSLSEVTWRDQRLPIRNEKLRVGLIKLQQLEGELRGHRTTEGDDGKMEMYEQLLMECQDAMQIVREDIAAETVSSLCLSHWHGYFFQTLLHVSFRFSFNRACQRKRSVLKNQRSKLIR